MHGLVVRDAAANDIGALAKLWFDGWQYAHGSILPAELRRLRTLSSFRDRLAEGLANVRVVEQSGAPSGLAMLKADELYQFYVAGHARGTDAAPALMADVLARLREAGVVSAWLACSIGNDRAARSYEKTDWRRVGTMTSRLRTRQGIFPLEVWRYEIELRLGGMLPADAR
ncbi:GNAT family N-acetyltransferase [Elioraea rosea]|uniref:GNAT family N-acetyltransferase n=1 Tax=Elioraea rosea TaxID=2492390 RepID=UPI00194F35AE|nr:GNAT family N-acetyltransferase [Elioraea rosea]